RPSGSRAVRSKHLAAIPRVSLRKFSSIRQTGAAPFWLPRRRDRWEHRFLPGETAGTRFDPHDAAENALVNLPSFRSRVVAARVDAVAESSLIPQDLSKR